ncbi:MAG TPA: hypothetical protein VIF62_07240 [Labilithrix sp.]
MIVLAALVGCTSILGSFDVASTDNTDGGNPGTEGGSCTQCGADCVDLTSSATHCGSCDNACSGGKTCQASKCGCPTGQAFCNGMCVSADRMHCGDQCSVCQMDEVCSGATMGCVPAPLPAFDTVPRDPTGWHDEKDTPISVTVKSTGIPGVVYECRSGPAASFTPTVPAWASCDGTPTGAGLKHAITPDATTPEGTYRTEHRYRSDTYRSTTVAVVYYALHKLDKVATCPRATHPEDGPSFTDKQIFDTALAFAQTHLSTFPITGTFPAPVDDNPQRTDLIYLHSPWTKIPFAGITVTKNEQLGSGGDAWPLIGANYTVNELNLRHKYALDSTRALLLVKRQYVRPQQQDCVMSFRIGSRRGASYGPTGRNRRHLECEALVLNARGSGICIGRDPANAKNPAVLPFDDEPQYTSGLSVGSNITMTAGSTAVTATFASTAWSTLVNNTYFACPAGSSEHWYKFVAAGDTPAPHATLDVPYQGVTGANVQCVRVDIASAHAYIMDGAFAKLHEEAHGPASAGVPSKRTKCTIAGCDTAKPWLTYLPP